MAGCAILNSAQTQIRGEIQTVKKDKIMKKNNASFWFFPAYIGGTASYCVGEGIGHLVSLDLDRRYGSLHHIHRQN